MSEVVTEQVSPDQWRTWRDMRLCSLGESPDAFGSTRDAEEGFDEDTWRSRLDGRSGHCVLAYTQGTPVGMGAGWVHQPGHMMVVAMWTHPAWRGRGVGSEVLGHLLRWADGRGLRAELWVADVNPAARRLYERHGFRADGRCGPLRDGSPLTKTHLVLSPGAPLRG